MATYVFSYKNQSYPNIHGHSENYEGKTLKPYSNKSSFNNIKSRYLAMMKSQLEKQQTDITQRQYLEALDLAEFAKLESLIENQIVENYNTQVSKLSTVTSNFENARKNLRTALIRGTDKEAALTALKDLLLVFYSHKKEDAIYQTIKNSKTPITNLEASDLANVKGFLAMIEAIFDNNQKFSLQWFNQAMTAPTESLASYLDVYGEDEADKTVLRMVQDSLKGTKSTKVTGSFIGKDGNLKDLGRSIITKSADIQMKNVKFKEAIKLNAQGVQINFDLTVDSYASVKYYTSAHGALNLTSYTGKNSLVMPTLLQIYGNTLLTQYRLYNTLAFAKAKTHNQDLDTNFRIIRQDMITLFAEKYIVGFDTGLAQRILIFNNMAYPVLSIINEIVENAVKQTKGKNTDPYGSLRNGSIFSISFSNAQSIQNEYNVDKEPPNLLKKLERITRVKKEIDGLASHGQLSRDALISMVKAGKIKGIKILK